MADLARIMKFTSPIRSNLSFFLFLWLFGSVSVITVLWYGSRLLGLIELPFDLYAFCALLMLFPERVRSGLKVLASAFLYLVGLIDVWCYHELHMPITASLLQLVLLTNRQESQEAVSAYWDPGVLLSPFGLLLLIVAAHAAVSLLALARRGGRLDKWLSPLWGRRGSIVLAVMLCASFALSLPDKERFLTGDIMELSPEEIEQQELFFDVELRANRYLPVYRLCHAVMQIRSFGHELERLPVVAEQTQVDSCAFTSPTIVLIIGESYNRHHSQLYGYDKATTPCQAERARKGEMTVFTDVVSAWNLTHQSFQDMFSLKTQDAAGEWYDYPLFTTMFRRAGYGVTLLSNQYVLSLEGRTSDFVEDLFVNEPRMSGYQFTHRNASTHKLDGGLLADYDSLTTVHAAFHSPAPSPPSPPQLLIFHFLGLHAAFNERYPANEAFFTPADYHRSDLTASDLQVLADYDNAMRYNDRVIEGILSRMEQRDAIVVCLADHGERIFDYGTTSYGRSMAMTQECIHQMYEIPFWIWCSEKYRENHPGICQQVEAARDKPWTTAHLGHLMLCLGGIASHDYYHDEANILSPRFRKNERIIGGKHRYEE